MTLYVWGWGWSRVWGLSRGETRLHHQQSRVRSPSLRQTFVWRGAEMLGDAHELQDAGRSRVGAGGGSRLSFCR